MISAFDIPNWRAIADGFTPALIAARTRLALAALTPWEDRSDLAGEAFALAARAGLDGLVVRSRRAVSAATPRRSRAKSSSLRMASELSRLEGKSSLAGAVREAPDR